LSGIILLYCWYFIYSLDLCGKKLINF